MAEVEGAYGILSRHVHVQLADMVAARAEQGRNYGVVLLPEGLIENVPEVRAWSPHSIHLPHPCDAHLSGSPCRGRGRGAVRLSIP